MADPRSRSLVPPPPQQQRRAAAGRRRQVPSPPARVLRCSPAGRSPRQAPATARTTADAAVAVHDALRVRRRRRRRRSWPCTRQPREAAPPPGRRPTLLPPPRAAAATTTTTAYNMEEGYEYTGGSIAVVCSYRVDCACGIRASGRPAGQEQAMLAAGWLAVSVVRRPRWGEREMRRRATVAGFGWRHGNGVALLIKPRCRNRRQSRPACGEMPLPGPQQIRPVLHPTWLQRAKQTQARAGAGAGLTTRRCVPRALPSRSPLCLSHILYSPSVRPTRRRVYIGYLAVHGLFPLRCVPNSVMFPKPSSK